ncbi:hypothetical protein SFUMM280S_09315 [Streptomyces fumanus]
MNVPVGLAALLLGLRLLPRLGPGRRGGLDLPGVALLGLGILAVMLPLVLSRGRRTDPPVVAVPGGPADPRGLRPVGTPGRRPATGTPSSTDCSPGPAEYATGAALATLYFVGFAPGLAGLRAVLPERARLLTAALRTGGDPARRRLRRRGGRRGPAGRPVRPVAHRRRARRRHGRPRRHRPAAVAGAAPTGPRRRPRRCSCSAVWAGCVISPNLTMTLREVPVRMAGAAGGALQTGQRLGGAVGTAALPGLFYLVLRLHPPRLPGRRRPLGRLGRRLHALRAGRRRRGAAAGPRRRRFPPPERSPGRSPAAHR